MTIYGPVQLDCVNDYWQVIGPRGGIVATFLTKRDAKEFIHSNRS